MSNVQQNIHYKLVNNIIRKGLKSGFKIETPVTKIKGSDFFRESQYLLKR